MREFGSEFDEVLLPDHYFEYLNKQFVNYCYTRTGREAIGLVVDSIKIGTKKVFLPSYLCPSIQEPFLIRGWEIHYYYLDENLSIIEDQFYSDLRKYQFDLVFLINYFGINDTGVIAKRIKEIDSHVKIIYDFTHVCLTQIDKKNQSIDYYVASIRKWFGISSGAVVLSDKFIHSIIVHGDEVVDQVEVYSEIALKRKGEYLLHPDESLKREYKDATKYVRAHLNSSEIYPISIINLDRIYSINCSWVYRKRVENLKHLWHAVKKIDGIDCLVKDDMDFSNIYFTLPLLLENRTFLQSKFADHGLYCQVIWSIPGECKIYEIPLSISKRILCVPIDQRYNYWDIEDMINIIKSVINE